MNSMSENDSFVAYMQSVFSLNPLYQAEQVVQLRLSQLNIQPFGTSQNILRLDADQIEILRGLVFDCQRNLWEISDSELHLKLDPERDKLRTIPELEHIVQRLFVWSDARNEFESIAKQPRSKRSLVDELRLLATLDSKQRGIVKETIFRKMQRREISGYQQQARAIEKNSPKIWAMEADWLKEVSMFKRNRVGVEIKESKPTSIRTMAIVIGISLFVIVVLVLLVTP
jgi:hypothetical protein